MNQSIRAFSVTHQLADVEIRELFSLDEQASFEFLHQMKELLGVPEALIVSTCNRTEVYYAHTKDLSDELLCLFQSHKSPAIANHKEVVRKLHGEEAILHLYRMAVGLESQVLGDIQIFGQVKSAYQQSVTCDMVGPYFHRLMHSVFYTHKRISQETKFKNGAASISYNAVKLLGNNTFLSKDSKILVSGIGSIGKSVCRNLDKHGYHNVAVTNRTTIKAEEIANACGFEVVDFKEHRKKIHAYDIVISTISRPAFYHLKDFKKGAVAIDLSSPRSILPDSSVTKLFDIDDVGNMADLTVSTREAEIPKVEQIINESITELNKWRNEQLVSPQIKEFKKTLEALRNQSLAQFLKKVDQQQTEILYKATDAIINKIVQLPVLQLKDACMRGEEAHLGESLNQLFNLENHTIRNNKN